MADIEVIGLNKLDAVGRALREAGSEGKGLKRDLYRELNRATKPVRGEMRTELGNALPHRGGLSADVLRSTRFTTQARLGGPSVGVRIRARGRRSIRTMNATGTFRHPVFGNRAVWVTQNVPKGFLDKPFDQAKPELRRDVVAAIESVRSRIYRSV